MANILTFTENIPPSRVERFEEVLKNIQDAAKARKIAFKWEKKPAIEIPVKNQAQGANTRGAYQDANGVWVIQRVPFTVTHAPLDKSGFMPVAEIVKMPNNKVKINRYGTVSDEQMEKLFPKIQQKVVNWTGTCEHCNPDGDGRNKIRKNIQLLVATKDVTMKTKKGNIKFQEGDISQVGSACLQKYTDIDPKLIAELYRLERAKRIGGKHNAPSDDTGWGWKTMDMIDFLQRCVMFFGYKEKQYLASRGGLARMQEGEENAKRLYSAKSEKFKVGYRMEGGTGVFPMRKGVRLLQARMVDIDGVNYLQPFKLADYGVNEMIKKWEAGDPNACKKIPMLDENGNQEYDANGDPMFIAVPNVANIPRRIIQKKFDKILPLDEAVVKEANNIRKWMMRLQPKDIPGKEDLVNNMKAALMYGYVGTKNANDVTEAWRYYNISTYDERVKKAKEEAEKKRRERIKQYLEGEMPDGKFRDVSKYGYIAREIRDLPEYRSYTFYNRAYDSASNTLWADDDTWSKLKAVLKEKEDAEKRNREAREEFDRRVSIENMVKLGNRELNSLANRNIYAQMPSKEEIIEIMDWDKQSEELNARLIYTNYRGDVIYIYARPTDVLKWQSHYKVNAPQAQPQVQQPQPPVAQNIGGAKLKKAQITQAEAKRRAKDCRDTSQYQGEIGDIISVTGYVVFISRPFRNKINGYGRSLGVLSDSGDYYLIWFYNKDVPNLGQYICLDDYEVKGHNYYSGWKLHQTVIDKVGQTWQDCTL